MLDNGCFNTFSELNECGVYFSIKYFMLNTFKHTLYIYKLAYFFENSKVSIKKKKKKPNESLASNSVFV